MTEILLPVISSEQEEPVSGNSTIDMLDCDTISSHKIRSNTDVDQLDGYRLFDNPISNESSSLNPGKLNLITELLVAREDTFDHVLASDQC